MRRILLVLFVAVIASGACSRTGPPDVLREELMETDRAFSRMSADEGRVAAFLEYMAAGGVVYPMQGDPVRGREEFGRLSRAAGEQADSSRLVWEPVFADVSASGDLGYTLGTYTASLKLPDGSEQVRRGNYVSIWKRQADGSWKFVFDGGNQAAPTETGGEERP
jgi:ketosteroid isomerase-like protein